METTTSTYFVKVPVIIKKMSSREDLHDDLEETNDNFSSNSEEELQNLDHPRRSPIKHLDESHHLATLVSANMSRPDRMSAIRSSIRSKPVSSPDSDHETVPDRDVIINNYNFKSFENMDVSPEIKEMFEYILRYVPQKVELEYRLKPFVPDYIPAVGDADAFLKVTVPTESWLGEPFDETILPKLGLEVLDEPCANQTDAALLYLKLKATSKAKISKSQMAVKKIENADKNSKAISQWINDIGDLHSAHPPPVVVLKNPMPSIEQVLQDMEAFNDELPGPETDNLDDYIKTICSAFNIPVYDNAIESLYVLFKSYLAIKKYYLYENGTNLPEINDEE